MTAEQILLVKHSWKNLRNVDPSFIGDVFYTKLFFDHPKLRRMFPQSLDEQYKKLINMLSAIVSRLDHPDKMEDNIKAMGQRHETYGVKPEHYQMAGNALLWTFEKGLGKEPAKIDDKQIWQRLSENHVIVRKENIIGYRQREVQRKYIHEDINPS